MLRIVDLILLLVSTAIICSCGDDESGLKCKSGEFYLDGDEFSSCSQCPMSDGCVFEANVIRTCTYPGGVQRCIDSSGTVTARCAGQTATVTISNGEYSCGK